MNWRTQSTVVVSLAFLGPTVALGQGTSSPSSDTASIILAPRPQAPTPAPKAVADTHNAMPAVGPVAVNMALVMPKYVPKQATSVGKTGVTDLREVDRPRNQIPRLPVQMMEKYVVNESKLPVFRTLDLYTKAGLTDLSFKEHPGLRIGNIFNLNAKYAYDRIVDEQLGAERQELVETALAFAALGDTEDIEAMKQAIISDGFNKESPVGK
jgi:hypothetical protein